MVLDEKWTGC